MLSGSSLLLCVNSCVSLLYHLTFILESSTFFYSRRFDECLLQSDENQFFSPNLFACYSVKSHTHPQLCFVFRELPATSRTQSQDKHRGSPTARWSVSASDMRKIPASELDFVHLRFTVISHRSTTVTRRLLFTRLTRLHPCAATLFQYVQLRQSRTKRQTSTPLGLATAGPVAAVSCWNDGLRDLDLLPDCMAVKIFLKCTRKKISIWATW